MKCLTAALFFLLCAVKVRGDKFIDMIQSLVDRRGGSDEAMLPCIDKPYLRITRRSLQVAHDLLFARLPDKGDTRIRLRKPTFNTFPMDSFETGKYRVAAINTFGMGRVVRSNVHPYMKCAPFILNHFPSRHALIIFDRTPTRTGCNRKKVRVASTFTEALSPEVLQAEDPKVLANSLTTANYGLCITTVRGQIQIRTINDALMILAVVPAGDDELRLWPVESTRHLASLPTSQSLVLLILERQPLSMDAIRQLRLERTPDSDSAPAGDQILRQIRGVTDAGVMIAVTFQDGVPVSSAASPNGATLTLPYANKPTRGKAEGKRTQKPKSNSQSKSKAPNVEIVKGSKGPTVEQEFPQAITVSSEPKPSAPLDCPYPYALLDTLFSVDSGDESLECLLSKFTPEREVPERRPNDALHLWLHSRGTPLSGSSAQLVALEAVFDDLLRESASWESSLERLVMRSHARNLTSACVMSMPRRLFAIHKADTSAYNSASGKKAKSSTQVTCKSSTSRLKMTSDAFIIKDYTARVKFSQSLVHQLTTDHLQENSTGSKLYEFLNTKDYGLAGRIDHGSSSLQLRSLNRELLVFMVAEIGGAYRLWYVETKDCIAKIPINSPTYLAILPASSVTKDIIKSLRLSIDEPETTPTFGASILQALRRQLQTPTIVLSVGPVPVDGAY